MRQLGLLPLDLLNPSIMYYLLFEYLPPISVTEKDSGRPPFPQDALPKALRLIRTLTDLAFELKNNTIISQAIGFNPYESPPSVERFSQFLRQTPHPLLQSVRTQLTQLLVDEKVVSGNHLVLDSCPILAKVRENNLKTCSTQRFEKTKLPKGDRDARLGVLFHFPSPSKKLVPFSWGYRNHIVADAQEDISLWEITHPADVSELPQAMPLTRKPKECFFFSITTVSGRALYAAENFLRCIINDLKSQAIIPRNPSGEKSSSCSMKGNSVLCQAGLPMHRRGNMTIEKAGITYLHHSCPIYYGNERQRHLLCPAAHPKFTTQKGSTFLIRLTPSIPQQTHYTCMAFKQFQKERPSTANLFYRLLSIACRTYQLYDIHPVGNYCTIAHIAVLLVALVFTRAGYQDNIRFVTSFVPTFLS